MSTSLSGHSTGLSTPVSLFTSSPRVVQPPASHLASHTACAFEASSSHRQSFYLPADLSDSQYAHLHAPGHKPQPLQHSTLDPSLYSSGEPSPNSQSGWDGIQNPSQAEVIEEHVTTHPMDISTSPTAQEFPLTEDSVRAPPNGGPSDVSASDSKSQKPPPSLPSRKQRWRGLGGMFGSGDKSHLPPVDELHVASQNQGSTPSLKRTQSSSTDSRSLPEVQPSISAAPPPKDPKKVKKEAARMAREAELQRRERMLKAQQEQSRAVMQNRNQIIMESHTKQELEWKWQSHAHLVTSQDASRLGGSERNRPRNGGGPIRDHPVHGDSAIGLGPYERMAKARRREFDDDHSMSSSDVRGSAVMSVMSFATNDSDPGPSLRTMPSLFFSHRDPSASSPLGLSDDFSVSGTSERSVSQHLTQGSMESSSVSDLGSPPPLHNLTLSPSGSWQTLQHCGDSADESVHQPRPSRLVVPSSRTELPYGGHIGGLSPSPGLSAPKSAINPIFKVVSVGSALSWATSAQTCLPSQPSRPSLKLSLKRSPSTPALPPFSSFDAVANRECQPLSPMSFSNPDDAIDAI